MCLLFYHNTFMRVEDSTLYSPTQSVHCLCRGWKLTPHILRLGIWGQAEAVVEADSRIVPPQDVMSWLKYSSISCLHVLMVIPCLSGTFHWSGMDAVVSECFVCEITLSCGQEVNSMCDNIQAKRQGGVSVLWTEAGWAELGLGEVEEGGLGCCSVE